MNEHMNVVDKIRKLCGVEHGGDWVFEKGKVREGKLLKEAVEAIEALHEELERRQSLNEVLYCRFKTAEEEAENAVIRGQTIVQQANSTIREFRGLAEAILGIEFTFNDED